MARLSVHALGAAGPGKSAITPRVPAGDPLMSDDPAETPNGTARPAGDADPVRDDRDGSTEPSLAIVQAVARATGTEPTALPALQRSIDADALDSVLDGGGAPDADVRVSFRYAGVDVAVGSDGELRLQVDDAARS